MVGSYPKCEPHVGKKGAAMFPGFGDPRLPNQVAITRDLVEQIAHDGEAKRIHFRTSHANALKRNEGAAWVGSFSVPFSDTIDPLFREGTGLHLTPSKNYSGSWVSIKNESDFAKIENWTANQGTRVFLRDSLALSIAIDFNFLEESQYTVVGELEMRAKKLADKNALIDLQTRCFEAIKELPFYSEADFIAAVPPRPGKGYDLPTCLARGVAETTGAYDLTSLFGWVGDKGSLKDEAVSDKWDRLEKAGLQLGDIKLEGKPVVLIDDLYQSGTTMQYVAMKLREAGAGPIFGLAVVKSWRDSDNQ